VILEEIKKNGKINDSNKISFSYSLFLANWWVNFIKTNPINFIDKNGWTALHWGLYQIK
jgi:hypothetical protein